MKRISKFFVTLLISMICFIRFPVLAAQENSINLEAVDYFVACALILVILVTIYAIVAIIIKKNKRS